MCNFENNLSIIVFKEMDIKVFFLNSALQLLKFSHNVSPPTKILSASVNNKKSCIFIMQ